MNLRSARVLERRVASMPEPIRIRASQSLREQDNFRWIEAEGHLNFAAKAEGQLDLELADGPGRFAVRLRGSTARFPAYPENSLVRVRGVCEAARGPDLLLVPNPGFDLKGRLGSSEIVVPRRLQGMHTWEDAFFATTRPDLLPDRALTLVDVPRMILEALDVHALAG